MPGAQTPTATGYHYARALLHQVRLLDGLVLRREACCYASHARSEPQPGLQAGYDCSGVSAVAGLRPQRSQVNESCEFLPDVVIRVLLTVRLLTDVWNT